MFTFQLSTMIFCLEDNKQFMVGMFFFDENILCLKKMLSQLTVCHNINQKNNILLML